MLKFNEHFNEMNSSPEQKVVTRLSAVPSWVFGIRVNDVVKSFCYHNE